MEVTQTDKAIALDCGCNTSIILTFDRGEFVAVQGTLNHCPLHVAAPKFLAALEHTIDIFGDHVGSCSSYLCREGCPHRGDARPWSSGEEHDKAWTKPCDCAMKPIRDAIEGAKK